MRTPEQKAKHAAAMRKHRAKDRDGYNASHKEYMQNNPEQREKRAARAKKWRKSNLERERARSRAYYAADPERHRGYWIKNQYGITLEQYNEMLEKQGRCCAICLSETPGAPRKKHWHVDHCHETKQVRGLLCHQCNVMLGNANDKTEVLRAAALYLERSRTA